MVKHRPRMSSKLSSRRGNAKTPYVCHKPPPIGPIIYPPPPPPPPPPPVCPPDFVTGHAFLDDPTIPYTFDADYSAPLISWDPDTGRAQYQFLTEGDPYTLLEFLLQVFGYGEDEAIFNIGAYIIHGWPPGDFWRDSNNPWTWCTHRTWDFPAFEEETINPGASAHVTVNW